MITGTWIFPTCASAAPSTTFAACSMGAHATSSFGTCAPRCKRLTPRSSCSAAAKPGQERVHALSLTGAASSWRAIQGVHPAVADLARAHLAALPAEHRETGALSPRPEAGGDPSEDAALLGGSPSHYGSFGSRLPLDGGQAPQRRMHTKFWQDKALRKRNLSGQGLTVIWIRSTARPSGASGRRRTGRILG
jgi:hypothetical protein